MNSADRDATTPAYVLGHSEREIDRLTAQARLIDPITRGFFRDAGIASGMRVGDPADMVFEQPFDAAIGRYVLQFQPDPGTTLRNLAAHVRSGGVIVFHEIDHGGVGSFPPAPTYDRCCRWVIETLRSHDTETRMGTKLHSTFVAAGFPAPSMRLEALIGGGTKGSDCVQLVADLVATLLPEMERLGIAAAADVGLETLAQRMRDEATASSSVIFGHWQIAAWSRV